jgi:competence protein ComEC
MTLEIVFWDVQHGSATYIKTPNGKHIVQDLGVGSYEKKDQEFSPLLHLKNKYHVAQLDQVIITHPHKDHINDILNFNALNPRLFSRSINIDVDEISRNIKAEDKKIFDTYFDIHERYNSPVELKNDPRIPENNGGVEIKTFVPLSSYKNINDHSLVTVISYAKSKILISGDNEPPSWKELLTKDDFRDAIKDVDIFLASHHGRESGYCGEIFNYFKPRLTIISDGRFCDTSATDRYSKMTQGWTVYHRKNGQREERKCITTRNDGVIVVKVGYISTSGNPFLNVTID